MKKNNHPNCLDVIRKEARKFKPIWRNCCYKDAFFLCNKIRKEIDVPEYSQSTFEEGYGYRNIFCPDWKIAKDEFINVVFGWW